VTRSRPADWGSVRPSYFAFPFGIIGLASSWQAAARTLAAPAWIGPALSILAAGTWLAVCLAYLVRLARHPAAVRGELSDPAMSPFTAFAPICAALLGAGLVHYAQSGGRVVAAIGIALTMSFGAWWTAERVLGDGLRLDQVHSAYLIPMCVGGIEAADAASAADWGTLARLCLGVGVLGWAGFGSLTLARLVLRPLPAPPLRPTLAIDAAVAAAVGVAYFNVYGTPPGSAAYAIAGYGLVMAGVQARLLPRYLSAPFTPGTWVFAFAAAVTATDVTFWISAIHGAPRWPAWAMLTAASALVAWIAARTALIVTRRRDTGPTLA